MMHSSNGRGRSNPDSRRGLGTVEARFLRYTPRGKTPVRPKMGDTSPPALCRGFFDGYPEDVDPVLGRFSALLC